MVCNDIRSRVFNTTPERSKVMSAIKYKDTRAEVLLRKQLWEMGARGYRKHPNIPGKPDLLFPKKKLAIFVDGCFWHQCTEHFRLPKTNIDYWEMKIQRNVERDRRVNAELAFQGYNILRIWEHEILGGKDGLEKAALRIIDELRRLK